MTHSIVDLIRYRARQRPSALAVIGPRLTITFAELIRDVDSVAAALLAKGLSRDDMVGLRLGLTYAHILHVLALDTLSIPSTSLASGMEAERLADANAMFRLTIIVAGDAKPANAPCTWIQVAEMARPRPVAFDPATLPPPPADPMIRINWSSGTTGTAKGTPLLRSKMVERLGALLMVRPYSQQTRHLMAMGLSTTYGAMTPLCVLAVGGTLALPTPGLDFASQVNRLGITALGLNPAQLGQIVEQTRDLSTRLETLQYLDVMGSHLPSRLAQETRFRLTPNLWTVYGSTEAGVLATGDAALCLTDPRIVGHAVPWAELEVVDEQDQPLPPGAEGDLRVRTRYLAGEYYRDPEASRRHYRNGWFHMGDMASIGPDGLVRILGRSGEAGAGDSPAALPLEEKIRAVPGVRDVAVVIPAGGQPHAFVTMAEGGTAEAVAAGMRAAFGGQAPELVVVDNLPRNANGKVLKRTLVAWLAGRMQPSGPSSN